MISKNKIKIYRQLSHKKYRNKFGLFFVEGRKVVVEAIRNRPELIEDILCSDNTIQYLPDSWKQKATITTSKDISLISTLKTTPDLLAVLKIPNKLPPFNSKSQLSLILDNIKDPGNMGTIIRMADWFGIDPVICSTDCVDCYNPKVVQATMGAIFRVNIFYTNLQAYISEIADEGISIYGTTLTGNDIYTEKLTFPAALILGNESNGISREIEKVTNKNLFIPNFSGNQVKSESLNVSTACAIALGEFSRQQFYSK